jgi:hypothetical protein
VYCKIAISISQRFLYRATAFKADKGDKNEALDKEYIGASIADKQAGYTVYIAGLIYTRGIIEIARAVAERRQQF